MNRKHNLLSRNKKIVGLLLPLLLMGITLLVSAEKAEKEKGRAFLGVSVSNLQEEKLKELNIIHGVRVFSVEKGEAADKAGIVKNDIIQFCNGQKIRDPEDLTDEIHAAKPGDQAKIKLIRDGKSMEVTATLGEREDSHGYLFFKGDKGLFAGTNRGSYLGVQLLELNDDLASYFSVKKEEGILVIGIEEKSPAEKAGLKSGDVITKVNGKKVKEAGEVREALAETKEGKAEIALIRHGKAMAITAEPEKHRTFDYFNFLPNLKHLRHISVPRFEIHVPEIADHLCIWKDDIDHVIKITGNFPEEKIKLVEEKMKKAEEKIKEKMETLKKKRVTIQIVRI